MNFYIITVCYNDKPGLARTYESIAKQSYHHLQWYVIDGGSVDGTKEWLESQHLDWLRFVSEDDDGIYDAMNKGIGLLPDDPDGYFIFMNAGDEFESGQVLEKIELVVRSTSDTLAFIYGGYIDVATNIKGKGQFIKKAKGEAHLPYGMMTSHQSMFFSIRCFQQHYYNTIYKVSADYDYLCRSIRICQEQGLKIKEVDFPICRFYLGGTSTVNRKQALIEDLIIRRENLQMSKSKGLLIFFAHYLHHIVKRALPRLALAFRLG